MCASLRAAARHENCLEGMHIMILGMTTFTFVHVVLSLIGIFSGFVVMSGLFAAKRLDGWTAIFLISTVATNLRHQRHDRSLSQCLRLDRAGFHEGAGSEGDGSDAVRAAIFVHATGHYGAFRRAHHSRGPRVPHNVTTRPLLLD